MIWSFSKNRVFRKCQRQWFYKACCASAQARDPVRHEAYLLSKLQSVSAWRGQIVDSIVETVLAPALNRGERPLLNDVLNEARVLFDAQLAFGRQHRLREPGLNLTNAGTAFAAFYAVEYGGSVSDEEVRLAWEDVETAFRNLYGMSEFKQLLRNSTYCAAQRALLFDHSGAKVRAVPDLIAFFTERPPLIVDWKVHTFGVHDYRDQLVTYAIALTRAKPHRDFPADIARWRETDIELLEVQLLRGFVRHHVIEEADVEATDHRIAQGILAMQLACDGKDANELRPDDFPSAWDPKTCQTCTFRKICWSSLS